MGELRELSQVGDIRTTWDPSNKVEVKAAKDLFDKLRAKKYFAYKVNMGGGKGTVIHEFDPQAEKIILALPMAGG